MTNEEMKQRLTVFFSNQTPIHINRSRALGSSYKTLWWNGIIKKVGDNYIILEEFKKGSVIVFFDEIAAVQTFVKREAT